MTRCKSDTCCVRCHSTPWRRLSIAIAILATGWISSGEALAEQVNGYKGVPFGISSSDAKEAFEKNGINFEKHEIKSTKDEPYPFSVIYAFNRGCTWPQNILRNWTTLYGVIGKSQGYDLHLELLFHEDKFVGVIVGAGEEDTVRDIRKAAGKPTASKTETDRSRGTTRSSKLTPRGTTVRYLSENQNQYGASVLYLVLSKDSNDLLVRDMQNCARSEVEEERLEKQKARKKNSAAIE